MSKSDSIPMSQVIKAMLFVAAMAGTLSASGADREFDWQTRPFAWSVLDFGAVGDGRTDDTNAIQEALSKVNLMGGVLQFPAGTYRVTRTLEISKTKGRGLILSGAGSRPINASGFSDKAATTLLWDGEEGGTLMLLGGLAGLTLRDMNFDGQRKAGILMHSRHVESWGSMLNLFQNLHFYRADVGIQLGERAGEHTNSDFLLEFITFRNLRIGMLVTNDQGVDFLMNYLFALSVGTVLDFKRGGNLTVNNAQMTNCPLFLDIGGGGRNAGTFVLTTVRVEWDGGGKNRRGQLLRANPHYQQALVRIIGFTDAQWDWRNNETDYHYQPLMEIGPGVNVSMVSSSISGPLAELRGNADAYASLIVESSLFSWGRPANFVSANEHGYFRLENNFTGRMVLTDDVIRWPARNTEVLSTEEPYKGNAFVRK